MKKLTNIFSFSLEFRFNMTCRYWDSGYVMEKHWKRRTDKYRFIYDMIYDVIWYDMWWCDMIYMIYDGMVWYMIYIWYDIYDVIYDIYMICDIWYMIYMIYDVIYDDIYMICDMIYDIYMIWSVIYMIWYDIYDMIYDIFNCKWVATRWQLYNTHLHTNNTQNDTKQYIEQHKIWAQHKIWEQYKKFGRVRAVPRLGELYPGICLTTEEKARKNLSQGSGTIRIHKPNNKNT
jgi:hypothetical protein